MSEVVTGDAVVVEVRVAQMPSRALAIIIDLATQFVILVAINALLGAFAGVTDFAMYAAVMILLTVLVLIGYPVIFESLSRGRSLGKLALGLRVVGDDGSPVRFRQALFRGLAGVLEFWVLAGAPALIASLVSKRGKRLGDVFAGTIVISDRAPRESGQVIAMPPPLAGWATTLELSQLPDEAAQAARQYLARWHQLSPQVQHDMGVRIATQVAAFVSPAAPAGVPPHAYLSAVLAERRRREQVRFAQRMGTVPPPQSPPGPPPGPYGPAAPSGPGAYAPPGPYAPPMPSPQGPPAGYPPPPQASPAPAPEPPQATPGGFAPPQ
ncbi:putative RDD family membrane protein YckC [Nonomuraea fuscirosea]|uniref:Putative RDD family membrane protein YckC n=1 Tax=Nonomuraea fuscirosea TaxID=1291556 RepID=A0A2T0N7B9_9ACTN|nr:RDD family protein [Nonomuraea fuscirosea]PRX68415.1 putative RDD family membrane protein YckC [Nonomuraea fuscirosea]